MRRISPWSLIGILAGIMPMLVCGCSRHISTAGHRDISFDISPDGSHIVFNASGKGYRDLFLLRLADSKVDRLLETPLWEIDPRFSPDGKFIVFSGCEKPQESGSTCHIYLYDTQNGDVSQLTFGYVSDTSPRFTSDMRHLIFDRGIRVRQYSMGGQVWTNGQIYAARFEKSSKRIANIIKTDIKYYRLSAIDNNLKPVISDELEELIISKSDTRTGHFPSSIIEPSYSPDGKHVAFIATVKGTYDYEVWIAPSDGSSVTQLTDLRSYVECLRWSPDGTSIYFLKLETGPSSMKKGIWRIDLKNKKTSRVADHTLFDDPLRWKP